MNRRAHRWLWVLAALPLSVLAVVGAPEDVWLPPLQPRSSPAPARFSHWAHQSNQCFGCHPAIFPQASVGVTHAQMQAGRFCGACHDGRTAHAITTMKCEACHVPR